LLIVIINKMIRRYKGRRREFLTSSEPYPTRNPLSLGDEKIMDGFFIEPSPIKVYNSQMTRVDNPWFYTLTNAALRIGNLFYLNQPECGRLTSVYMRYSVTLIPVTGTSCIVRLLVVYDRQPGSIPGFGDLFDSVDVLSPITLNARRRFLVLMDRVHDLEALTMPKSHINKSFYRAINLPYQDLSLQLAGAASVYAIGFSNKPNDGTGAYWSYRATVTYTDT